MVAESLGESGSTEANKAVVRRLFAVFWNGDTPDIADALIHPRHISSEGTPVNEGYKQGLAFWRSVFPDLHFTVDEITAEGSTVVARWTVRGTHQGAWVTPMGTIPPTGKTVATPGTSSYHLADGKIMRSWHHVDFLSQLHQVGATITPAQTSA